MMKTLVSKITVTTIIGFLWGLAIYFDLIRQYVPGFYCEGFGCLALGLAYLIYIPIISFLIIGFFAFLFNKENRIKHILVSIGIMAIVLIFTFFIINTLNVFDTKNAIKESEKIDEEFKQQLDNDVRQIVEENSQQGARGYIQKKYENDSKKQEILFHLIDQLEEIAEINDVNKVDRYEFSRTVTCIINNHANELMVLEAFVFNTENKKNKYIEFNTARTGYNVGWDYLDDVDCNIK